jgi:ribosome-binding factor A
MTARHGRPPSRRQLRVGEEIRHALSRILARGAVHDPDLEGVSVTVTEVSVSPDLKNATAFVMPLAGAAGDATLAALRRAEGFLRGQVAREVQLRQVPRLKIDLDTRFDYAGRIEAALRRPKVARDLAPENDDDGGAAEPG